MMIQDIGNNDAIATIGSNMRKRLPSAVFQTGADPVFVSIDALVVPDQFKSLGRSNLYGQASVIGAVTGQALE